MRKIACILFVLGVPWALVAWIAVLGGPAGAVEDLTTALNHRERLAGAILQIPVMLLLSTHAAAGYYVWLRWFRISRGTAASTRRFWIIASAHHAGWVIFAIACCVQADRLPIVFAMLIYALLVLLVCMGAAVHAGRPARAI